MNWPMIMMETVVFLALCTAMVMIPSLKNPLAGIHNYPPEIQEEYFKTHERIPTNPLSKRTILIKSLGILIFAAVLTGGALLAEADSFGDGFLFGILLFTAWGVYDTVFIDWVLFAHMKQFRLPGTEHMEKAYTQKWFHVKVVLFPGSLYLAILGLIVGGAVALIR